MYAYVYIYVSMPYSCGIFLSIFDRNRKTHYFDSRFRNKFPTNQNILAVRATVPKACAVLLKKYSIIGLIAGTKKKHNSGKRFNLYDGTRILVGVLHFIPPRHSRDSVWRI